MVLEGGFWGVLTLGFWGPKGPKNFGQYKPLGHSISYANLSQISSFLYALSPIKPDWSIALRTTKPTKVHYSAQKLKNRRLILDDRPNLGQIRSKPLKT
jgi:hypothetical protein